MSIEQLRQLAEDFTSVPPSGLEEGVALAQALLDEIKGHGALGPILTDHPFVPKDGD